mmetsp:Transcript_99677/g.281372  ORF Transcript_99677/g.281372 Transcript_99677/m.281372 type:complete len:227 (+) Transcript_99677:879-1559(+)
MPSANAPTPLSPTLFSDKLRLVNFGLACNATASAEAPTSPTALSVRSRHVKCTPGTLRMSAKARAPPSPIEHPARPKSIRPAFVTKASAMASAASPPTVFHEKSRVRSGQTSLVKASANASGVLRPTWQRRKPNESRTQQPGLMGKSSARVTPAWSPTTLRDRPKCKSEGAPPAASASTSPRQPFSGMVLPSSSRRRSCRLYFVAFAIAKAPNSPMELWERSRLVR